MGESNEVTTGANRTYNLSKLNYAFSAVGNYRVFIFDLSNINGTMQGTFSDIELFTHAGYAPNYVIINFNVKEMGIDALSLSSHKINGPKGVGALYLKKGINIKKFMLGGEQEKNMRAGTLNTPAIVGFGKAVEIATRDIIANSKKLRTLRDYFIREVQSKIDYVYLNGHSVQRLPNNVSLAFGMVEGESILFMLDMAGIAVSTGSACESGSVEPSHVLKAMNIPQDLAQGTVRFSLGKTTTKEQLDYVVEQLVDIIKKLRHMSPISKSQIGNVKKGDKKCIIKK